MPQSLRTTFISSPELRKKGVNSLRATSTQSQVHHIRCYLHGQSPDVAHCHKCLMFSALYRETDAMFGTSGQQWNGCPSTSRLAKPQDSVSARSQRHTVADRPQAELI